MAPVPDGSPTPIPQACVGKSWYVSKSAIGTNQGTSWTNAWNEMSKIDWTSIKGGDTLWLAAGTYLTQILPAIPQAPGGTAESPICILRVTKNDAVAQDLDWNAGFDGQVVVAPQNIQGDVIGCYAPHGCDYTIWDGRTQNGIKLVLHNYSDTMQPAGNGTNALHWATINLGGPQGSPTRNPNGNIAFKNFELYGPYYEAKGVAVGYVVYGTGLFLSGSQGAPVSSVTLESSNVHGFADFACMGDASLIRFDHNRIYDIKGVTYSGGDSPHANIVEGNARLDMTFSYNAISNWDNEGIFFGDYAGPVYMYGNIFDNTSNSLESYGRVISTPPGSPQVAGVIYFYNNTVINTWCPFFLQASSPGLEGIDTSSRIFDNIYWWTGANFNSSQACGFPSMPSAMQGHEYTNFNFGSATPSAFVSSAGATAFVNAQGQDYHLTATLGANYPRNAGTPIANVSLSNNQVQTFNIDMDGITRASGGWDVGAYQYSTR